MKSWEQGEIEALAHEIWVKQGCPEGRALENWREAEEIFRERWFADQEGNIHQVRDLRARVVGVP